MNSHALPVATAFVAYALVTFFRSSGVRRAVLVGLFASQVFALIDFAASRSVSMPLWTGLHQVEHYSQEYGASQYSYFDLTNRDHLRNIPTIHQIDRILDQLLEGDREKVHIMAHQMGVMPYYIVQKYFGRVQFLDLNGLTDRVATDATAFASLDRTMVGTTGVMAKFMRDRTAVEADPDFTAPDLIVYQFYQPQIPRSVFENLGYEVLYVQTGEVSTGSRHFPGRRVWANQLIAVRRDLVPELVELPPPQLDIRETGIVRAGSAW